MRIHHQYFFLGIYDGLAGLIVLPYTLSKEDGWMGFVVGFWMEIGGAIFKPLAGEPPRLLDRPSTYKASLFPC